MGSFDLLSMALRNLWKRKLRTFLTVLGVIIGTASIVVMVSIGIGMNESYKLQLEEMGSLQVIDVYSPSGGGRGGRMSFGVSADASSTGSKRGEVVLDTRAIEEFKKIPGVEAATPTQSTYLQIVCGKYKNDVSFVGIDPEAAEALGYKLSDGRFFEEGDKFPLLVGEQVQSSFYNPKLNWQMRYSVTPPEINLMEEKVKISYDYEIGTKNADKSIKPYKAEVVGILSGSGENSYSVVMPLKDLEAILNDQTKYQEAQNAKNNYGGSGGEKKKKGVYDQAKVKVEKLEEVQRVQDAIKEMGYEASSLSEYLDSMQEGTKMLQMGLGAIGAISLFVAAIGIANTMIMSIYERTREIGVMKVIGASLSDIRKLFLTEAAFIGLSGGVVGTILSLLLSKIINVVGQATGQSYGVSSIPIWLGISALLFATFVGIAAGYFPAKRAMKLSALSAIKTE